LQDSVDYIGPVDEERKEKIFQSADVFVLPSFTENFGLVVAEALAHGVPVITTHGTPWEGLVSHSCGWWIEPTVDALVETLQEAMNMEPAELQSMGEKGREYAHEFDWAHIAHQTAEVYRWVLGMGAMPDCVVID
jgi:glycosyltransferase involved in cell wall biosynthesis